MKIRKTKMYMLLFPILFYSIKIIDNRPQNKDKASDAAEALYLKLMSYLIN